MTPKEKADELFDKYSYELSNHIFNGTFDIAKQCALIAVDEVLKTNTLENRNCGFVTLCEKHKEYWQEVKQEIEKI